MIEDFWDWLPKAYGDVGDEPVFTKYNMEVAFAAGAEAEAKRMWQGLTDDELDAMRQTSNLNFVTLREFRIVARAVEAKLKERNG